jgi:Holliday junction DNA helicase RuvA
MSRFALLVVRDEPHAAEVKRDVVMEAFEALRLLGHSEPEARKLIDGVLQSRRKFASVEDVLSAVYQQSHSKKDD